MIYYDKPQDQETVFHQQNHVEAMGNRAMIASLVASHFPPSAQAWPRQEGQTPSLLPRTPDAVHVVLCAVGAVVVPRDFPKANCWGIGPWKSVIYHDLPFYHSYWFKHQEWWLGHKDIDSTSQQLWFNQQEPLLNHKNCDLTNSNGDSTNNTLAFIIRKWAVRQHFFSEKPGDILTGYPQF